MVDNEIEASSETLKKNFVQKMSVSRPNLGQKRRRSATPMRPVAIAPKTNLPKNIQNLDIYQTTLAIKTEPGSFITIVPKNSEIIAENNRGNKSAGNIEQFEIFDSSFTAGSQNSKRIKLATSDDIPMQYMILQNQNQQMDNCSTIYFADNDEKISISQPKNNLLHDFNTAMKNNTIQQFNVIDRTNLVNCSSFSGSQKLNFTNEDILVNSQNSDKLNFIFHKNDTTDSPHTSNATNHVVGNESKLLIPRNGIPSNNRVLETSESSNIASMESPEASGSKSRSRKPIVIMQQLISPPNKTNSVKTRRVLLPGLNKLLPLNIQGLNMEGKIFPEHASPPKSNESYYESKTVNHIAIKLNNENGADHENDFLLKKEFPVISSSQVDSVLKAIDMQGLNRGTASNELNNQTKKHTGDHDADIGRSLPIIQGAEKLSKAENTQCANNVNDASTRMQTNHPTKRLETEKPIGNCPQPHTQAVEKLVDTLHCYKCKECSYMSLNEKHVFEHVEREHINVPGKKEKPIFNCPGCSNTFSHEASLLSHIVHDHQVHESEARIMAQQLSSRQSLPLVIDNPIPVSQIRVTKIQNEQIFITQTQNPLVENNQRAETLPALPLPSIGSIESGSPHMLGNSINVENGELECIQSINNMPVIMGGSLETVDVQNIPFLTDDKAFPTDQMNEQLKVLDAKNIEYSENPNLIELKSSRERNFEFVNFKDETHEGEGYLPENDPMGTENSDSEMEFVALATTESIPGNSGADVKAKIKKKGRPKGARTHSTKPQLVSLKQGYKCEVEDCGVRMLVQENIAYHQKCHVSATTQFQCPECIEFKTNNWNNLAGHLWRSHIIDMELHSCDLCSYKTPSYSNLTNQHKGIHRDDRPFVCNDCGKGFKTTKQLRNHRAMHRAKAKEPLQCDECRRDFTNTRLLKLHKESVHKESKPFTCSSCPYSASTRSALKLHLRRHTGEKPFSCDQCSYSTGDHNSLRRHRLRHLGLKPYSCPHCTYACIQSSTYKVHLKNKHPGNDHNLMFSCQYCSYKSIKKDNLLTHMAKHEQVSNKSPAGSGSPIVVE